MNSEKTEIRINVPHVNVSLHWEKAINIVLHKKDDMTNYVNYRGISLVAHVGKVLLEVVTRRL